MTRLCICALLLFSSSAHALTETLQNLTPQAGQSDLRVGAVYQGADLESVSGSKATLKGSQLPMSFYYGFGESSAVGVDLAYTSFKIESNTAPSETKGFEDIFLGYKGNISSNDITLFTKFGVTVPPEKKKVSTSTTSQSTNSASSGQPGLAVGIGLVTATSTAKIGFMAQYLAARDGKADITNSTTTVSGTVKNGSAYGLGVFSEWDNSLHPNLAANYARSFTRNLESDDGLTTVTYKGFETVEITGGLRFTSGPGFEILPAISYTTYLNQSDLGLSKADFLYAGVGGRFLF